MNLNVLNKYIRGEDKFTHILSKLNISNQPYSNWTNPIGILRQLEEGLAYDEVTVFYMVNEASGQDADFQTYREVFRKIAQDN